MRIGEATNLKDLVQACEATRVKRLEMRRGFDKIWWDNLAMIAGDHYAQWHPLRGEYISIPKPTDDTQLVINHCGTVIRTEHARLTKSKPVMQVLANGTESVDIASTKVALAALAAIDWKFQLRQNRKQAIWLMLALGTAATYVGYDQYDEASGMYEYPIDPQTKEVTFDPDRKKELEQMVQEGYLDRVDIETHPLGDLCFKNFSAFQLLPDTSKLQWAEITNLITTEVLNVDEAIAIWSDVRKDLKPDAGLALGTVERRLLGSLGFSHQALEVDDALEAHTFWLLPNIYRHNRFLKDGCMLRWAKGGRVTLEFAGRFPYHDNRIPFTFYTHIPQATTIWGKSMIEDIRHPNLELNKKVSQLIDNADYMGNPQWLIATQHQIVGKIKNKSGGIIRYVHNPNVPPPQRVEGVPLPVQFQQIPEMLANQIMYLSGQTESAHAQQPNIRSGVQVAYLNAEDETKLGPTADTIELAVARESSLVLSRLGQYYSVERLMKYQRKDGLWDVISFKGADLKGVSDVVPVEGSALPVNKAARQQYTLELVQLGIETDKRRIQQMLELGEGDPDDTDKAIAQAQRENMMMLHGMQVPGKEYKAPDENTQLAAPPVFEWMDHKSHVKTHVSMMMDEQFDNMGATSPEIVRLFNEHIAMHQQVLDKQMQQQMQQMLAMKGGPTPGDMAGGAGAPPQMPEGLEGAPTQ